MVRMDEASATFLHRLATTVPLAVIATDAAGVVQVWSQAAEKLYGWSASECIGRPITSLTVDPLDGSIAGVIMAQVSAGQPWAGRYHARTKTGDIIEVFVIDSPLYAPDGKFVGVVGLSVNMNGEHANSNPRWVALRSVAAEVNSVREQERADIARRLHDDIGQVISIVRLELSEVAVHDALPGEFADRFQRLFDDLDIAVRSIREITGELFYRDFDVWLLVLRLFDLATEAEKIDHVAAVCEIAIPVDKMRLVSSRTAYAAFNIAREAMSNVRRHSQARLVRLCLDANDRELHLTIEDNGDGVGTSPAGIGRQGMRQRAEAVGGRVEVVDRAPTGVSGTRVFAALPFGDAGGVIDEHLDRR